MRNWKTTLSGIVTILSGIVSFVKGDIHTGCTLVATGVGLIVAKDYDNK
jgi:hypothetical protein